MKRYIGTKIVQAQPQAREGVDGYTVQYEDGYMSWSPADTFHKAYRAADGLTFGLAIDAVKLDQRVARAGWNGKGMWLEIFDPQGCLLTSSKGGELPELPWVCIKTTDDKLVPWVPTQTDMLAEDWVIV
jgi:hypothetical protein